MIVVVSLVIILSTPIYSDSIPPVMLRKLPDAVKDEVNMTFTQIIAKYNYPVELHQIVTQDGYILTLHRIPNDQKTRKGSILVVHGILASSTDWIIMGPKKGLAYVLADEGYDVWLGNCRGNKYSRNHTTLSTNSPKFWNFSWHEIAIYDVPAMIDYILEVSKEKRIFHIGHSQGTTTFYVMCAMKPEYNEKIRAHFSMAPVAYVTHITSPFMKLLARQLFWMEALKNMIGLNEFMPKDGLFSKIGQKLCNNDFINKLLCTNSLFAICGFNHKSLNTTLLPLILAHIPAGSSTKQFIHYAQEFNSGRFCQFDYGSRSNFRRYNSRKPPDYNLTQIRAPMYFFYSKNDWMSSKRDVENFARKLPNLRGKFLISDEKFNHLDYLFGINATEFVYNKIISLMTRH